MRHVSLFGVIAAIFVLSGCKSGNIFNEFSLTKDKSLTTGARQRLISNVTPGIASRPGRVDPYRIICVEPSPDVAVAVANSIGAGLGLAGKGSFSISGASAEGLAQIAERTTAIQAILKQGYHACIDYMNGAISGTTYSMRQSRLDDLLVTLLLGENAAGAYGRSGVAIGTNANAASRAVASIIPTISNNLEQANADLAEKQKNVAEEQAALDKSQAALDAKPGDKTLEAKRDANKAKLDIAIAGRDAALRSVTGLTESASNAAAGVSKVVGHGGIDARPNAEIAKILGEMQERFLNKDSEQAYIATCLTELGLWKVRDVEDDKLRALALKKIEADGALDKDNAEPYYLAHQIGMQTRLTKHCENNLSTFLVRAQNNSHNRRVMTLEIEGKRVDVEKLKLAKASTFLGLSIHPLAAFNVAAKANEGLKTSLNKLNGEVVPEVNETFAEKEKKKLDDQRQKALDEGAKIQNSATILLSDQQKNATKTIEDDFIALIADTRRNGSQKERDGWQKEFEIQQKQADLKDAALKAFTQDAVTVRIELDAILSRIKRVKK